MGSHILLWVTFNIFIILMLLLDIYVFNKTKRVLKIREALVLTGFWVSLAIVFDFSIYFIWGSEKALEFATGYIIEQSLSVDNLFVILMLFAYFKTPGKYQQKVLLWGVLGAIFFRILFILTGVALIHRFEFAIYILGGFLVITSIKMLVGDDNNIEPDKNIVLKMFRKIMPVTSFYDEGKFITRHKNIRHATPLLIALIVIETTDIIFAADSIPAIIAVSKHPFIIYSSNIFAVLGLRSLFFVLSGVMNRFHLLKFGISGILFYIGAKILLGPVLSEFNIQISIRMDLLIIAVILSSFVFLSLLFPKKINENISRSGNDESI